MARILFVKCRIVVYDAINMDTFVKGIEPQPQFPKEDLTQENSVLIELLLTNVSILGSSHSLSEALDPLYKAMHPPLNKVSEELFHDTKASLGFNTGVAIYEAISAMVQKQIDRNMSTTQLFIQGQQLLSQPSSTIQEAIEQSYPRFFASMQRTAEVVATVSNSRNLHLGRHAIYGAAYMYSLENDLQAA